MKRIFIILCLVAIRCSCIAQSCQGINVIITFNDKVGIGAFNNFSVISVSRNEEHKYECYYSPGDLNIKSINELKLDSEVREITLSFSYTRIVKNEAKTDYFCAVFNKVYLQKEYFLLNFILDKTGKPTKYYQLIFPGGSIIRSLND